ncbi:hypothetical protein TrVE_jg2741 [Triparma verrucosa]|uniref:Uncharacterized protein n=1 Tax=Triparma verrucosa TaxID=1606542 RepID=A0A9W7FNS9_9STRA|nr:hypothetical protein TrVE_jg2741 [Triparma verrucosa]
MVFTGHENDTDVEETLKPTLVAPPGLKIVNRGDTPTSPSPNRKKKKKKKQEKHSGMKGFREDSSGLLTLQSPTKKTPTSVTKDSEGNEPTLIIRECAAMCLSCGLTGYACYGGPFDPTSDYHISLCLARTDHLNWVCGVNALTGCCFCCLWPAWAECVHKAFGVEWDKVKEQRTFTTRR